MDGQNNDDKLFFVSVSLKNPKIFAVLSNFK